MKSLSQQYNLHPQLSYIIRAMMRRDGKDFNRCELCLEYIADGKADLHHTKYKGSTYYDLQIVCHRCNSAPENRYLA